MTKRSASASGSRRTRLCDRRGDRATDIKTRARRAHAIGVTYGMGAGGARRGRVCDTRRRLRIASAMIDAH
ncbi:MAG: hypothetical protein ACLS7Z_01465 [Christensenellales bacterium]